jgi:hypothetical protein
MVTWRTQERLGEPHNERKRISPSDISEAARDRSISGNKIKKIYEKNVHMKIFTGLVLGFMSGFMIYMMVAMTTASPQDGPGFFVILTLPLAWIGSTVWLVRNTRNLAPVFRRGFLLGAAEWLAIIPAGSSWRRV